MTRKERTGLSLAPYAFEEKSWTLSEKPGRIGGPMDDAIPINQVAEQAASSSTTSSEVSDIDSANVEAFESKLCSRQAGAHWGCGGEKL
jgi:hypothetical protein